jgi:hypothetical protein
MQEGPLQQQQQQHAVTQQQKQQHAVTRQQEPVEGRLPTPQELDKMLAGEDWTNVVGWLSNTACCLGVDHQLYWCITVQFFAFVRSS